MNARALRSLIGLLIIGVSILAVSWALLDLIRTGSCASGGVYVSARECPPGTGEKILALIGGIFGVLIGAALAASARGAVAAWGLGFGALSATFFVSSFGPAASPDLDTATKAVSIGVGSLFALMALPALIGAVARPNARGAGRGGSGGGGSRRIVMAGGGTSTSNPSDFWNFNQGGGDGPGWSGSSDSGNSSDSGSSDSGSSGCSSGCGGGCGGGGD